MENQHIKVLHVEDNAGDVRLLRELLGEAAAFQFDLTAVPALRDALPAIAGSTFDVALLDLSLPDSQGLESVRQIRQAAPHLPVVIMTGQSDRALAFEALKEGAQDYLEKDRLTSYWLARAILYAMERHRLMEELHALTLVDDLTGLSNRRGFFVLAEQQLKLVRRMQNKLIVMYADLDGLKQINDTFGHQEGDRALIQLSQVLRKTFRDSDIIARIGGDEFALFAADSACADIQVLPSRLQKNLEEFNALGSVPYPLSISVGTVCLDFVNHASLQVLLDRADRAMYAQKQGRHHER